WEGVRVGVLWRGPGLNARGREQVEAREGLRVDLSDEHLVQFLDGLLSGRGIEVRVRPPDAALHEFVLSVRLRGKLSVEPSRAGVEEGSVVYSDRVKETVMAGRGGAGRGGAGATVMCARPGGRCRARVGDAGGSGGGVGRAGRRVVVGARGQCGRRRGDLLSSGAVGKRRMVPFVARLEITPEVRSYHRHSQIRR